VERGYPIGGAEDHGATISVYLSDPDGNGIELYYDRLREEWGTPRPNHSILGSDWRSRAPLRSLYSPELVTCPAPSRVLLANCCPIRRGERTTL
jgi:hypothetical protein